MKSNKRTVHIIKALSLSVAASLILTAGPISVSAQALEESEEQVLDDAVSYTAYTSLYWLEEASVPEAKDFASEIGDAVDLAVDTSISHYEQLAPVNEMYFEMRYSSQNNYIVEHNYRNVLDVACGFAPRAIFTAREGLNYVGVDFQSTCESVSRITSGVLTEDELSHVSYEAADATDEASMTAAADTMDGEVCITMDGLLMYLTHDQQAEVLKSVRKILETHGGAFITCDFAARDFVESAAVAAYGDTTDAWEIYEESARIFEETTDVQFDDCFFRDDEEAAEFIESQGLHVEMLPLFDESAMIYCTEDLNEEQIGRLPELMSKPYLWVITLEEA